MTPCACDTERHASLRVEGWEKWWLIVLGEVSGKVSPPNGFLLIVTSQTNFSFCLLFFYY